MFEQMNTSDKVCAAILAVAAVAAVGAGVYAVKEYAADRKLQDRLDAVKYAVSEIEMKHANIIDIRSLSTNSIEIQMACVMLRSAIEMTEHAVRFNDLKLTNQIVSGFERQLEELKSKSND